MFRRILAGLALLTLVQQPAAVAAAPQAEVTVFAAASLTNEIGRAHV